MRVAFPKVPDHLYEEEEETRGETLDLLAIAHPPRVEIDSSI